jgi:hypothetical protein
MAQHAKTEDLEMFLTVVDSGSFSAAANLLKHLTNRRRGNQTVKTVAQWKVTY